MYLSVSFHENLDWVLPGPQVLCWFVMNLPFAAASDDFSVSNTAAKPDKSPINLYANKAIALRIGPFRPLICAKCNEGIT